MTSSLLGGTHTHTDQPGWSAYIASSVGDNQSGCGSKENVDEVQTTNNQEVDRSWMKTRWTVNTQQWEWEKGSLHRLLLLLRLLWLHNHSPLALPMWQENTAGMLSTSLSWLICGFAIWNYTNDKIKKCLPYSWGFILFFKMLIIYLLSFAPQGIQDGLQQLKLCSN